MSQPTDAERLTSFLRQVDAYEAEIKHLPVPASFNIGGPPRDPADQVYVRARISQLRKFAISRSDPLYLPTVAASLDRIAPVQNEHFSAQVEQALNDAKRGLAAFGSADGTLEHADAITSDEIYGGLLHGDPDKEQRSLSRPQLAREMATWSWISGVERLVLGFARDLRRLIADGKVTLD